MKNDYDQMIQRALEALPERVRREIRNVAFLVEDGCGPTCDCGEHCDGDLLGLYEGVPLIDREGDSRELLPDKITLFRRSIKEEAEESNQPLEQVVRETVWHEVSHFFGFDEDKAEEMEQKWERNLNLKKS